MVSVLLWAALGYGAVLGLVYLMQPRLLYFPEAASRVLDTDPSKIGLRFQNLTLTTEDGERLHAWFVRSTRPRRGALLFCHGNAGNIGHRLDSIRLFADLGLDVLIFDYRGYGRSTGSPSEQGTYRDATAAWDWLTGPGGAPAQEIVLFGRSLGAAVAVELATRVDAAGLILESGFTSVPELGAELYPALPVRWLSRYRYDSVSRIGGVGMPVLVIHSRDDEIIPFRHGRSLFESAVAPKHLLPIEGGHNDGFLVSASNYRQGLHRFLEELALVQ
jgi:fermentation-respiration switch protein FrsA (DUF1100 family)